MLSSWPIPEFRINNITQFQCDHIVTVDYLTLNEENRWRLKLVEITKKKDEIEAIELKHQEEIGTIKQQMNQLMVMVQKNPRLAYIKPEVLLTKQ